MHQTTDKIRSLVKKWQTSIDVRIDVKTVDGFVMRVFVIGFTKRRRNQIKKFLFKNKSLSKPMCLCCFDRTSYAQTSQIRLIRKRIINIILKEATKCNLNILVKKFVIEVSTLIIVKIHSISF